MRTVPLLFLFFFSGKNIFSQPNPRHLEEVVYDNDRKRLLLFGGAELNDSKWEEPAMVYEWDGKNWYSKEARAPSGRRGHGWVYDQGSKEAILIGGVTTGKTIKDSVLFDVWRWDGDNWKLINTICPVKEPEAVYDVVNKRILVYGDAANRNTLNYKLPASFELWEYKNDSWKKLSTDGPDIRGSKMISYDAARKRLVVPVFEEAGMTVWEWAGNEWLKIFFEKDCPGYRTRFALVYDPVDNNTLLFGGLSDKREQLADFWKWNGKQWQKIETKASPSVRSSAHFACGNNQLLLYGGSVPKPAPQEGIETCNELWAWKNGEWKKLK